MKLRVLAAIFASGSLTAIGAASAVSLGQATMAKLPIPPVCVVQTVPLPADPDNDNDAQLHVQVGYCP